MLLCLLMRHLCVHFSATAGPVRNFEMSRDNRTSLARYDFCLSGGNQLGELLVLTLFFDPEYSRSSRV